jgi:hypothetical protein
MVVGIDDGGLISLNGKTVADAQLGPLLIQAKGTDPNTTVLNQNRNKLLQAWPDRVR